MFSYVLPYLHIYKCETFHGQQALKNRSRGMETHQHGPLFIVQEVGQTNWSGCPYLRKTHFIFLLVHLNSEWQPIHQYVKQNIISTDPNEMFHPIDLYIAWLATWSHLPLFRRGFLHLSATLMTFTGVSVVLASEKRTVTMEVARGVSAVVSLSSISVGLP